MATVGTPVQNLVNSLQRTGGGYAPQGNSFTPLSLFASGGETTIFS